MFTFATEAVNGAPERATLAAGLLETELELGV
jgi:hypothetical protein